MNRNTMKETKEQITNGASASYEYVNDYYADAFEEWSTAGIGNAFLFGKVMTANLDLLLELLQYSLPEFHIRKIERTQREVDVKLTIDSHGVRLDILTSDDQGRTIDVEMQMKDEKNIPHRMRYYESSIDQMILEKGRNYNALGDLVILFITPFDPFEDHGLFKYTFQNVCLENRELVLKDGVTKVVLNAKGREGSISEELKDFLQLVADSVGKKSGPVNAQRFAEGSFAARIQKQVEQARRNARWRKEYMDWEMTLRNEREKGREEERANTERERKRAEQAEDLARQEKERADEMQAELERLRSLLEEHGVSNKE